MKSVLFLCTDNYYRSRFAEELFNYRAERGGIPWSAFSRALALERGIFNVGALSAYATKALAELGLAPRSPDHMPQQCTIADLEGADRIVALKESEHRRLLVARFPGWDSRVEYWHVDDVEHAPPAVALSSVANHIDALLKQLQPVHQT